MAMHDSDPERRNLMVTSIAFIAYFYAGGSFTDSTVRLQVINAEFAKPGILALIAWCAFSWFIYRYWVTHRGKFIVSFSDELKNKRETIQVTNYVNKSLEQKIHFDAQVKEYHASSMRWKSGHIVVGCSYANVKRNIKGRVASVSTGGGLRERGQKEVILSGVFGWLLAFQLTFSCIIKEQSFSSYVIPYVLSGVAIFGAIYKYDF